MFGIARYPTWASAANGPVVWARAPAKAKRQAQGVARRAILFRMAEIISRAAETATSVGGLRTRARSSIYCLSRSARRIVRRDAGEEVRYADCQILLLGRRRGSGHRRISDHDADQPERAAAGRGEDRWR